MSIYREEDLQLNCEYHPGYKSHFYPVNALDLIQKATQCLPANNFLTK